MNCNCQTCKEALRMGAADVEQTERLHRYLPFLRFLLPPLPPFRIGQQVKCVADAPAHGFRQGQKYIVESLFLSEDRSFWFLRAYGMPSSTDARQFEL